MLPIINATTETYRALSTGYYTVEVTIRGRTLISRPIQVIDGGASSGPTQLPTTRNVVINDGGIRVVGSPLIADYTLLLNGVNSVEPVDYQWMFIGQSGNPFTIPVPYGQSPLIYPRVDGRYYVEVRAPGTTNVLARSPTIEVTGTSLLLLPGQVQIDGTQWWVGGNLYASYATMSDIATWQWYLDGNPISGETGTTLTGTPGPGVYTVSATPNNPLQNRQVSSPVTVNNQVRFLDRASNDITTITPPSPVRVPLGTNVIARPTNPPLPPTGPDSYQFRGWYTTTAYDVAYPFGTTLTSGTTNIFADWGFRLGDEGPGGGIVYVRSDTPIPMVDPVNPPYHYLESWHSSITNVYWASPAYRPPNPWLEITPTANIGTIVGTGRRNTTLILDLDPGPNAASFAKGFDALTGTPGWFLPSIAELQQLAASPVLGGFASGEYWSSSQTGDDSATAMVVFPTPGTPFDDLKNQRYNVRPIRAF
jgi:hypothetical protein